MPTSPEPADPDGFWEAHEFEATRVCSWPSCDGLPEYVVRCPCSFELRACVRHVRQVGAHDAIRCRACGQTSPTAGPGSIVYGAIMREGVRGDG